MTDTAKQRKEERDHNRAVRHVFGGEAPFNADSHCVNCGYPTVKHIRHCPSCGFYYDRAAALEKTDTAQHTPGPWTLGKGLVRIRTEDSSATLVAECYTTQNRNRT